MVLSRGTQNPMNRAYRTALKVGYTSKPFCNFSLKRLVYRKPMAGKLKAKPQRIAGTANKKV